MNNNMSTEALDALPSDLANAAHNSENTEGMWRPAVTLFLAFTLLTGLAYPLLEIGRAHV